MALADFANTGVEGANNFTQVSPSVYTFLFWVGFTDRVALSLPRFAGSVFPPNEFGSIGWRYAPLATWSMSDGLTDGATTSLRLVTATATFATPVKLVDDEGFDFEVYGCTKGAWRSFSSTVYDIELVLGSQVRASMVSRVDATY